MNNVTSKILGWLPNYNEINSVNETIPHAHIAPLSCPTSCYVDIIRIDPNDMSKNIGLLTGYTFEIVTNACSPEFYRDATKTIIIRTPITTNHSSYDETLYNRCWDIHDAIGNNKYSIAGVDGVLCLYAPYAEREIINNSLGKDRIIYGINMIESLAKDYRRRLNNMGYNCY